MKLRKQPPDFPFWVSHRKRKSVYEEVEACKKLLHRCTTESLDEEWEFLKKEGFPDDRGLFQNGFFCRLHDQMHNDLCEKVFEILQRFTPRDQIAFPFIIWKMDYKPVTLLTWAQYSNIIRISNHKVTDPKLHGFIKKQEVEKDNSKVGVHHITPGRSDKNFGKSINDIIKSLPDDDWICLRDIDTIPMYHEVFFEQCEQVVNSTEYDLIGCMTNRLGLVHQLYNKTKSNESDILIHRNIAHELYKQYGSETVPVDTTIGGLFMLFSKKTWKNVGGFVEGGIQINGSFIDYHFCKAVLKKGMKIGLAKGIYLFHYYRLHHGDQTKSKESKQHLV
jgi:hypothetical protein